MYIVNVHEYWGYGFTKYFLFKFILQIYYQKNHILSMPLNIPLINFQTKDYEIGICCFSAYHAALRRKNKDGLARNQNNVSEWSDMSTHRLLFQ